MATKSSDAMIKMISPTFEEGSDDENIGLMSKLADLCLQRAEHNGSWLKRLQAHDIYNQCGHRDPSQSIWYEKTYGIEYKYHMVSNGNSSMLDPDTYKDIISTVKGFSRIVRHDMSLCFQEEEEEGFDLSDGVIKSNGENGINLCNMARLISKTFSKEIASLVSEIMGCTIKICGQPTSEFSVLSIGSLAKGNAALFSDAQYFFLIEKEEHKKKIESLVLISYFLMNNLRESTLKIFDREQLAKLIETIHCDFVKGANVGSLPTTPGQGTPTQTHFIRTVDQMLELYEELCSSPKQYNTADLSDMLAATTYIYGSKCLFEELQYRIIQTQAMEARKEPVREIDCSMEVLDDSLEIYSKTIELLDAWHFETRADDLYLLFCEENKNVRVRATHMPDCEQILNICLNKNIADEYTELGDHNQAIRYHNRSLRILKQLHGDTNHPDIANAYNYIGLAYQDLDQFNQAISFYIRCLEILNKVYGHMNHHDIANSCLNIASAYTNLGDYIQAINYYKKSLEIRKRLDGEACDPSIARIHHSIAFACSNLGDYSQAINNYKKFVEVTKRLQGDTDHPEIATSYINIAKLLSYEAEYNQAICYFKMSLEIMKRVFGDHHHNIAMSYRGIAEAYTHLGNQREAILYYHKSLEIWKEVYGYAYHPDIAKSYISIGDMYTSLGDYNQAISYYENLLKMMEQNNGDIDQSTVSSINQKIANAYSFLGDHDQARSYYNMILEIEEPVNIDTNNSDAGGSCRCNCTLM